MTEKVKIASIEEIPEKIGVQFEVDNKSLAVFRINGEIFVINNLCPHQHAPVLFEGDLDGYILTCPLHGWKFDLKTGKSTGGQGGIKKYPHMIEGNDIFIEINKDIF